MSTQTLPLQPPSPWGENGSAFQRQVTELLATIAAVRGVPASAMGEQYEAFYAAYLSLDEGDRPATPADWLYQRRFSRTAHVRGDRAAMWAAYRCLADPHGITGGLEYASIDIEVSGPSFPELANPANGCIIEIGVACYDQDATEIARLDTLVAPSEQIAAAHGTGPVHIHGITMDDVADAPAWGEVAPQVTELLSDRILLAHNVRFEHTYLSHHMAQAGAEYGPDLFADSLHLAQHSFNWPNHKLGTVCAQTGVDYTDGHRAFHDAEVAAQAFFAMRSRLHREYQAAGHVQPSGAGR